MKFRSGGPLFTEFGDEEWYNSLGFYHREDGPAIIHAIGTKKWFINGLLHRIDGPTIIHSDGSTEYWINGGVHRIDGPAAIYIDGRQYWYVNNKMHCDNKSFQKEAKLTDEDMLMITLKYGNID